jgi:hypothetical protein
VKSQQHDAVQGDVRCPVHSSGGTSRLYQAAPDWRGDVEGQWPSILSKLD